MIRVIARSRNVSLAVRVAVLIGQVMDLRAIGQGEFAVVLHEYIAKQLHCREQFGGRQGLFADDEYRMTNKGLIEFVYQRRVDRCPEIESPNFDAGMCVEYVKFALRIRSNVQRPRRVYISTSLIR